MNYVTLFYLYVSVSSLWCPPLVRISYLIYGNKWKQVFVIFLFFAMSSLGKNKLDYKSF